LPIRAANTLREVATATNEWRAVGRATGIPDSEVEEMEQAFEHEEAVTARAL